MKTLNKSELDSVISLLEARNIKHPQYKIEFFDHITTMIESEMNAGSSFDTALTKVMSAYSDIQLNTLLHSTSDPELQKSRFKTFANRVGIVGGLLICFWFLLEFIIGQFTGILELGAFYGLLSELIFMVIFVVSTKRMIRSILPETLNFRLILKLNVRVILIATGTVMVFAPFYTYFINPQLNGIFDHSTGILVTEPILFATTMAMVIGTFIEGIVIGFIASLMGQFCR